VGVRGIAAGTMNEPRDFERDINVAWAG
jgi:hypothetical protein